MRAKSGIKHRAGAETWRSQKRWVTVLPVLRISEDWPVLERHSHGVVILGGRGLKARSATRLNGRGPNNSLKCPWIYGVVSRLTRTRGKHADSHPLSTFHDLLDFLDFEYIWRERNVLGPRPLCGAQNNTSHSKLAPTASLQNILGRSLNWST